MVRGNTDFFIIGLILSLTLSSLVEINADYFIIRSLLSNYSSPVGSDVDFFIIGLI